MKIKMTKQDWEDVADLCEQGAVQAELTTPSECAGSHSAKAIRVATEWMNKLAEKATIKSLKQD